MNDTRTAEPNMVPMTYKNIQGMRGIACLMVVAAHSFWPLLQLRTYWFQPYITAIGPAGVDIFFVISGFVVYQSADRIARRVPEISRWQAFREFTVRRVFRIYPVYWVAFAVASLLMRWVELAPPDRPKAPWPLLALLVGSPNNRIEAAWTLQIEVYFYAICAVAILLFPRKIVAIVGSWVVIILCLWIVQQFGLFHSVSWYLTPLVLEFAFGILIAHLALRRISGFGIASLAGGVVCMLLSASYLSAHGFWGGISQMQRVWSFGLPAALIIYGVVAIEIRGTWQFSKSWVWLGNISYSTYLWHQMLFAVLAVFYLWSGIASHVPNPILVLSFFLISIPMGALSFRLVENPSNRSRLARLAAHGRHSGSARSSAVQESPKA